MRTSKLWMLAVGGLAVVGCGSSPAGLAADGGATTRERLAGMTTFDVAPADTMVQLAVRLDRGDHDESARITLPVTAGAVELYTSGGELGVDDFALDLAPVDLPATVLPGVRLTNIHVGMAEAAVTRDAAWSDGDDACTGSASVHLHLDWSIQTAGGTWPLTQQDLDDVQLGMVLGRDGDTLTFAGGAMANGVFWKWDDLVMFGDLTVSVHARS